MQEQKKPSLFSAFGSVMGAIAELGNAVGTGAVGIRKAAESVVTLADLANDHALGLRASGAQERLKELGVPCEDGLTALIVWDELVKAMGSEEELKALMVSRKAMAVSPTV